MNYLMEKLFTLISFLLPVLYLALFNSFRPSYKCLYINSVLRKIYFAKEMET